MRDKREPPSLEQLQGIFLEVDALFLDLDKKRSFARADTLEAVNARAVYDGKYCANASSGRPLRRDMGLTSSSLTHSDAAFSLTLRWWVRSISTHPRAVLPFGGRRGNSAKYLTGEEYGEALYMQPNALISDNGAVGTRMLIELCL